MQTKNQRITPPFAPPFCGSQISSFFGVCSALNRQEASITWCDLFRPKFCQKMPKTITSHDVHEPLQQVLSASRDVIISGQICGSKLQRVFILGDGCWLPIEKQLREWPGRWHRIKQISCTSCLWIGGTSQATGARLGLVSADFWRQALVQCCGWRHWWLALCRSVCYYSPLNPKESRADPWSVDFGAAKLPNPDLNFAVDYCVDFPFGSKQKGPAEQVAPRASSLQICRLWVCIFPTYNSLEKIWLPKTPFWRGLSGTNSGGRFAPRRFCSLPIPFFQGKRPQRIPAKLTWKLLRKNSPRISAEALSWQRIKMHQK